MLRAGLEIWMRECAEGDEWWLITRYEANYWEIDKHQHRDRRASFVLSIKWTSSFLLLLLVCSSSQVNAKQDLFGLFLLFLFAFIKKLLFMSGKWGNRYVLGGGGLRKIFLYGFSTFNVLLCQLSSFSISWFHHLDWRWSEESSGSNQRFGYDTGLIRNERSKGTIV